MELFAADGHDAGGCERVTGKSGMRPIPFGIGAYVLRYRIHDETVVVIRVWHSREVRR